MNPSNSIHRKTLVDILNNEIQIESIDESLPFYTAATRVLISWLDYEVSEVVFIDSKDNGIDAWYVAKGSNPSESGIDIFQIKTHERDANGFLRLDTFDHKCVDDIMRAKTLLLANDGDTYPQNKKLQQLITHWSHALRSRQKTQHISSIMPVTLNLVLLGEGLTSSAQAEFDNFQATNKEIVIIDDVQVQFNAVIHNVDSIVNTRWRESNREWKDISGRKQERIVLNILKPTREGGYISDDKNAIFYCKAIDLVNAYTLLGYQLFELNVRANIKRSRVNQAIRDSIKYARTRKEFRFLNNGVTITCQSYKSPRGGRKGFDIQYPGVVNGLQTVIALHTAYHELSHEDKEDFEENCSVLVRLLNVNAVDDITKVVRATNNQNPMKPRNLVSNSPEQVQFARLFASSFGWFYQAKEGAWDAFEHDHRRWRPPLNKAPRDFRTSSRKIRKIDNHELAQNWLSFIGYSFTAWNDKRSLFDENYDFVFKMRTKKHGFDYGYSIKKAREEADKGAPDPSLMLVAYLTTLFVKQIVPSHQQNRREAIERLAFDPELTRFEVDSKLLKDKSYTLNLILRSMPFLFTEFVGFVLYQALGNNIHRYGGRILANHSLNLMMKDLNTAQIKQDIADKNFTHDDVLVILWLLFVDTFEGLAAGNWGKGYHQAARKQRYIMGHGSRDELYREIISTDDFAKERLPMRTWAIGLKEKQGIFDFIRESIQE